MPLVKQHNTWAQAVGKSCLNTSPGNGLVTSSPPEIDNELECAESSSSKVIKMEENSSESQIAAAFSEGWGQRGVNQDTAWDLPSSPILSPKEGSNWSNSNSGTEIWENNVRHHIKNAAGKPPTQMREPWGHAPSTHMGGIWGEEEDTTNMWTGVPPSGAAWQGEGGNPSVWPPNPAEGTKNWAGQNNSVPPNMNPNWGNEPSALQLGLPHMPLINDKNMSEESPDHAAPWADPQKNNRTFGNWSPVTGGNKKIPPSGWDENAPPPPPPPNQGQPPPGTNFDDGTAAWGNPVHQGKVCHWKEMPPAKQMAGCVMPPSNLCPSGSPGMIRLPQTGSMINKNDWMKGNCNLSWNEMPSHAPGGRIWEDNVGPEKGILGASNSSFGNWGESEQPIGPYWSGKSKTHSWADGQVDTSNWGGPLKQTGKPLSKDLIWASTQFGLLAKMNFKKEDIENALRRNNMNVEDALIDLRSGNTDLTKNLNQPPMPLSNVGEDLNFPDHSIDNTLPPGNMYGRNNMPGMNMFSTGFNIAQNCKNQNPVGNNIASNAGTTNQVPNFNLNNGINNLNPAMMQKMLQTQAFNPANIPQNSGRVNPQHNSMNAQLRYFVQQIKLACLAGYLNPTILTQPLAPQTLRLLFQILHQIRIMHQLQQHGHKPAATHMNLVSQTKQQILSLQNLIAAQQASYLKQHVQLPMPPPSLQNSQPSTFDVVKSDLESMNGLHSEFRDLSLKDSASQGHSRLTQWKLSSFDKEDNSSATEASLNTQLPSHRNSGDNASIEFSRAPGPIAKSSSANNLASTNSSHSNNTLQPLSENSWPDMSRQGDTWSVPNDSINQGNVDVDSSNCSAKHGCASDPKDSPPSTSSSSQAYNLNDLVPEFEPGKPWKGTSRIKNFEDDPHVTPGSITKSPLSINNIKDSDLFPWKLVQNMQNLSTSSSLTSSTWTFSPTPTSSQNSDISTRSGRSWQGNTPSDQEWKGQPKTSRPPPGLCSQNKPITSNWMGNESVPQGWSIGSGWEKQSGSNFLVLKNLTPQIDGSTLKTLCLQHGPLQLFHLLLNHGLALVRYSTREETEKAHSALNNCVLSNTTILVDIPTEMEVKQYLQLASGQMTSGVSWSPESNPEGNFSAVSNGSSNSGSANKLTASNWNNTGLNLQSSNLWSYSGSGNNSLWASGTPDHHDQCIPSSLNSFLPGDLLGGGESM